jgi:hypothetical protein
VLGLCATVLIVRHRELVLCAAGLQLEHFVRGELRRHRVAVLHVPRGFVFDAAWVSRRRAVHRNAAPVLGARRDRLLQPAGLRLGLRGRFRWRQRVRRDAHTVRLAERHAMHERLGLLPGRVPWHGDLVLHLSRCIRMRVPARMLLEFRNSVLPRHGPGLLCDSVLQLDVPRTRRMQLVDAGLSGHSGDFVRQPQSESLFERSRLRHSVSSIPLVWRSMTVTDNCRRSESRAVRRTMVSSSKGERSAVQAAYIKSESSCAAPPRAA